MIGAVQVAHKTILWPFILHCTKLPSLRVPLNIECSARKVVYLFKSAGNGESQTTERTTKRVTMVWRHPQHKFFSYRHVWVSKYTSIHCNEVRVKQYHVWYALLAFYSTSWNTSVSIHVLIDGETDDKIVVLSYSLSKQLFQVAQSGLEVCFLPLCEKLLHIREKNIMYQDFYG